MRVAAAREALQAEEATRLVDMERVRERRSAASSRRASSSSTRSTRSRRRGPGRGGPDVSREGVQRDLLPIVEGSTVQTKHGPVRTDHVLFIAAGAFHVAKPSDLIPELQGRFPIRVELSSLGARGLRAHPDRAAQLADAAVHGAARDRGRRSSSGSRTASRRSPSYAARVNERTDDIGARRLHTVMEKLLEELSFEAPDLGGSHHVVDADFVRERLEALVRDEDLSRYIL